MDFKNHHSSSVGNLYSIVSEGNTLLIECGVPMKKIREALDHKLADVCGCLVSHHHRDHSLEVNRLSNLGIDCYMHPDTKMQTGCVLAQSVDYDEQFYVCGKYFTIKTFETTHYNNDGTPCDGSMGFLISDGKEKLLFAVDLAEIPTHYHFSGLTKIAIECNWSHETITPGLRPELRDRIIMSHMGLDDVRGFLMRQDLSGVTEIHLLHLSARNADAKFFQSEIQKLTGVPVYAKGDKP